MADMELCSASLAELTGVTPMEYELSQTNRCNELNSNSYLRSM
jgi:hypothetical protein